MEALERGGGRAELACGRIVLACAETGSPRRVGERLDVHLIRSASGATGLPSIGWRAARRAPFGRTAQDRRRADRGGDQPDPREPAGRRHALELTRHGQGQRPVHRHRPTIWRAFGLQPHRVETFKLSTDPDFIAKVRDVVGLYMAPPDRALVLCVDEKSQIQALDRTQPLLPMRPGRSSVGRTTTSGTARPRCSRRSMSRPDGSSANVSPGTGPPSSAASRRGRGPCPARCRRPPRHG